MDLNHTPQNELVAGLDQLIAGVIAAQLPETAALLKIARLSLVLNLNDISENEFQEFLAIVEQGVNYDNSVLAAPSLS